MAWIVRRSDSRRKCVNLTVKIHCDKCFGDRQALCKFFEFFCPYLYGPKIYVTSLNISVLTLSVRTTDSFDAVNIYTEDGLAKPKRFCPKCVILVEMPG